MRPFTARRLALAALVPALLVLSMIPGCSNQSEGERCGEAGTPINNDDCSSGLVCTLITSANTYRCCYPNGNATDSRCVQGGSTSATSQGGGSNGGDAGASSTPVAGSTGVSDSTPASSEAGAPASTDLSGVAGAASEVSGAGGA